MKAVCFQPHNDDCAIAIGGSIQKMVREGWDLTYVYVTDGTPRERRCSSGEAC